jgi:tRNA threonylcarbamoyladenosine biosynthesis protein TsaB
MWLAIDASTATGTAALFHGSDLVGETSVPMRGEHEERLMPAIVGLVTPHGPFDRITRVVVGGGPGSFTSLRIAAAIAKGLAHATGAELWAVPSLALAVAQLPSPAPGRYVAVLDAMRGEYYALPVVVRPDGSIVPAAGAPFTLVRAAELADYARLQGGRSIGPGGATDIEAVPHARGARRLIDHGVGGPVDLARWEPEYGRLAEAQVRWEAAHGRPLSGERR